MCAVLLGAVQRRAGRSAQLAVLVLQTPRTPRPRAPRHPARLLEPALGSADRHGRVQRAQ